MTPEFVQAVVARAWNRSAFAWECQALRRAAPGVIVEELVLATPGGERPRVLEIRCHVAWARSVACEYASDKTGAFVFARQEVDVRLGWALDAVHESATPYTDSMAPVSSELMHACLAEAARVAERVAAALRADHLRVDQLVRGECTLFVSEVELYPAMPFSPHVQELLAERWRYGYGTDPEPGPDLAAKWR